MISLIKEDERFTLYIEGERFVLRRVSWKKLKEFKRKMVEGRKDAQGRDYIYQDQANEDIPDAMIDYMIVEWSLPDPCTKENKLSLPPDVITKINKACENTIDLDAEKKTSPASLSLKETGIK